MKRFNGTPECPDCGNLKTFVRATYHTENNEIIRQRECANCEHKFWSYQEVEIILDTSRYSLKIPKWASPKGSRKIVEMVPFSEA